MNLFGYAPLSAWPRHTDGGKEHCHPRENEAYLASRYNMAPVLNGWKTTRECATVHS